jgi:hypothetical protein
MLLGGLAFPQAASAHSSTWCGYGTKYDYVLTWTLGGPTTVVWYVENQYTWVKSYSPYVVGHSLFHSAVNYLGYVTHNSTSNCTS